MRLQNKFLLFAATVLPYIANFIRIKILDQTVPRVELPAECTSFTLIHGRLSDARLIILGEDHSRTKETWTCIDALTKNPNLIHVIYQEGRAENDNMRRGLRTIRGWEDMDLHYKLVPIMDEMQTLKGKCAKEFSLLKSAKKLSKLETIKDEVELRELSNIIAQYNQSFFKCKKALFHKSVEGKELHLKRNEALISAVKNAPKNQLALVTIGKAHIVPTPSTLITKNFSDFAAAEYTLKELEKFSHENPYAILVMK